jgi:acyl-CoA reductase-like NAD-dependent aldehyde dehydrogenase
VFVFNVTVNNGLSEEQLMSLKETLAAGKAEILSAIAVETNQHADRILEAIAQHQNGDLTSEELAESLKEIADGVRGIVPDPAPVEPSDPGPTGTGE